MRSARVRTLVVENDPERLVEFRRRFGREMVEARDYREAVAALAAYTFQEVWLDFDLDGRRNGADVAHRLTLLAASRRPTRVVCQSTNLRGAYAITVTLSRAGVEVEQRPWPSWGRSL